MNNCCKRKSNVLPQSRWADVCPVVVNIQVSSDGSLFGLYCIVLIVTKCIFTELIRKPKKSLEAQTKNLYQLGDYRPVNWIYLIVVELLAPSYFTIANPKHTENSSAYAVLTVEH